MNPSLDDTSLKGARSLLLSITGGRDLTLWEVDEAANRVRQEVDPHANIIVGATFDESLGDKARVSAVASAMGRSQHQQSSPAQYEGSGVERRVLPHRKSPTTIEPRLKPRPSSSDEASSGPALGNTTGREAGVLR